MAHSRKIRAALSQHQADLANIKPAEPLTDFKNLLSDFKEQYTTVDNCISNLKEELGNIKENIEEKSEQALSDIDKLMCIHAKMEAALEKAKTTPITSRENYKHAIDTLKTTEQNALEMADKLDDLLKHFAAEVELQVKLKKPEMLIDPKKKNEPKEESPEKLFTKREHPSKKPKKKKPPRCVIM